MTSCTLDPPSRTEALAQLREFALAHGQRVTLNLQASFTGEKEGLRRFLADVLAREAQCCSFLELRMQETAGGYDVVLAADRDGLRDAVAIASAFYRDE